MKQLKNLFDEKLLKFILVGVVNTLVGMAIMLVFTTLHTVAIGYHQQPIIF